MTRRFALLLLLLLPLALIGCSSSNSNAPTTNEPHPTAWLSEHPDAALAVAGFADCTICHGANLKGSGETVSCYSCHSFNTTPPFVIHPVASADQWFIDHRDYATTNGATRCAKCHGADLHGSAAAPSCFSTSFDAFSCHSGGPGVAPHAQDGSYLSGSVHGPDAKSDLSVCQTCHGQIGDAGDNPQFNLGIISATNAGCEGCHNDFTAHPSLGTRDNAHWYGATVTHADAGNLSTTCTLCHGVNLGGLADGGVGPACSECHNQDPVVNSSECVSCHNLPPDGGGIVGAERPNRTGKHDHGGHGILFNSDPTQTCGRCHSGAGFGTDNHFDLSGPAVINFAHPDAGDTISVISSDNVNTTCTGACHIQNGTLNIFYPHTNATWY